MKKLLFIIATFLVVHCAYAQLDTNWAYRTCCLGETTTWTISMSIATDTDTCVCIHNGLLDTIIGRNLVITPDSSTDYILLSINGQQPSIWSIYACKVTVNPTVNFTVDSIHHVTCPIPYLGTGDHLSPNSWADGSFSVHLEDSIQNYEYIRVWSDSSFFFSHYYYDDFTISGLRGGTYNVTARSINGCEVTQQVTIQQSPTWSFDYEHSHFDTIKCTETGSICFLVNGGTPPFNYEWHLDSDWDRIFPDTCELNNIGPGDYWCWITDANGCLAMDAPIGTDIYQIMMDTVSLLGTQQACYGEEITFTAWSHGHGDYVWSTGDSTMDIITQLDSSSWVSVQFTDQNRCISSDSLWIEVHHPQITLLEDMPDHWCQNDVPLDLNEYVSATPAGGTLYFNGIGNSNGIVTQLPAGETSVAVLYQEGGCFANDTMSLLVVVPETIQLQVPATMFKDSTYEISLPYPNGRFYIDGEEIPTTSSAVEISPNNFSLGMHDVHYEVEAGAYGCKSEYDTQVEIRESVGVAEHEGFTFNVYPNPARDILNVEGSASMGIEIYDIQGRILRSLQSEGSTAVDISDMSAGVYFIRLVTSGSSSVMKFVKHE